MSQTSASSTSRSSLSVGTVFYYRDYEGVRETKPRYFVVVGTTQFCFLSFTATTNLTLLQRFPTEVTPRIEAGATCLPKDSVVDCRTLYEFDDIQLSSYLNSGRVAVRGRLSDELLRQVLQAVSTSKILERRKKRMVIESLQSYLSGGA